MKIDLTTEEIHALIEWHDGEAAMPIGSEDEVDDRRRSRERADELYFLVTGAKRGAGIK